MRDEQNKNQKSKLEKVKKKKIILKCSKVVEGARKMLNMNKNWIHLARKGDSCLFSEICHPSVELCVSAYVCVNVWCVIVIEMFEYMFENEINSDRAKVVKVDGEEIA